MTREPIMPDFVHALEQQLRIDAISSTPSPAHADRPRFRQRRVRRWRLLVACSVAIVVAGAIVTLPGSEQGSAPRISVKPPAAAFGKPRLLTVAPVQISPELLGGGSMIRAALGPDADLNSGRPFAVTAGTAYLIGNDRAWCITVPIPSQSAGIPATRGVTCAPNSVFIRFGISLRVGPHYVAAVPQGVKNPTLERSGGTAQELKPSALGVVTVDDLQEGDVITLYAPDGTGRRDKVNDVNDGTPREARADRRR